MSRTTHRRLPWGAGLLAVLVAGSTAAAVPATASAADAAADPQVVVSTDFSDGTYAPWTSSGGPTLSVVPVDGDPALLVSGRAADFDGIQSPTGLLEPGVPHTFSMRARLAPGTVGTAGVRFVVKPTYTWVGNTTMSADAWTTVTGTVTAPADADPAALQVYLGTADLTVPYDYLVDDILITREGGSGEGPWVPTPDPSFVPGGAVNPVQTQVSSARGTGDVAALTFDDGPNPGETDRLLDFLTANDLTATFCVIGQNITADGGAEILRRIVAEGHTLCNHTTSYADMGSWTQAQVEADLKANLAIIRTALGDPTAAVPYFRAPNGSWGVTPEVAVALGMQPLGLGNIIFDWDGNDLSVETLTAKLDAAVTPGAVVLAHDGGGNRDNTITAVETVIAERLAAGWTFTLPEGGADDSGEGPGEPDAGPGLRTSFEDGLDGWGPRGDADGDPTVAVTTEYARTGSASAQVSDRTSQGDGIGRDVSGLMTTGTTYDISAWVRFAPGAEADDIWLSMASTAGGTQSFATLGQFTGITAGAWTEITATYQVPEADSLFLYLETPYPSGSAGTFLVDDIVVTPRSALEVEDLTPLKETVPFRVGVAIDERETTGSAAQLLTRHFGQVTPENHMKPEAWYAGEGADTFRLHPQAEAIMDFAQAEDLSVYGHVLVWHGQTPAWFFTDADGTPLTTSEADQAVLRERMRTHIFSVAETLATQYGPFGSDTNPLTAWDVVNEVVSDSGEYSDGLRRSEWYRILGEEFIDLAFTYADEAFNDTYAAEGSDRPVTLFINDYNTEQSGKQERYRALVERLLARKVPLDGVGHQFHVSLSFPVEGLEAAIVAFEDLGLTQVVTELDVTTGTPVTEARLVDQGYYYRDAFAAFRRQAEDLYAVTVWGLTDGRSWRASSGAPLLFDDALKGKPAYYGAAGLELPARQRSAFVFSGDVALDGGAVTSPVWDRLPLLQVEQVADFQLRWQADHLTAYVVVADASSSDADQVSFIVAGTTYVVERDGQTSAGAQAVVQEVEGGYSVVAHLPLGGSSAEGDLLGFDVQVSDNGTVTGWNEPGATGTLTLVEPLSYTETVETSAAPTIDGLVDEAWSSANVVTTDKQIEGTGGATAAVRTLWKDNQLYVLAEVTDPTLDATGSDPWIQDSLEIFLDAGNVKNGPYRYDDTQIRISYLNVTSFGAGDEAFQDNRLVSATRVVDGGYVVEASISLLESGGLGSFQGLDLQVNDATAGARTSIRSWADPTGLGYQSTARWGVAQLVAAPVVEPEPQPDPDPVVTLADRHVRLSATVPVELTGYVAGSTVELLLSGRRGSSFDLGSVVVGEDGSATATVTVPAGADRGRQTLTAASGQVTAWTYVVVQGPATPVRGRS